MRDFEMSSHIIVNLNINLNVIRVCAVEYIALETYLILSSLEGNNK
jgi:hypothetical protein